MLIVDELYVSETVLNFLEESQEPVFNNEAARQFVTQGRNLNLASTDKPTQQRVVALSEMHLAEAKDYYLPSVAEGIALCKDKAAFRAALQPLYPTYYFASFTPGELMGVDANTIPYPVVVKPACGFFSLGIYPCFNTQDWQRALADIQAHSAEWTTSYNSAVINDSAFIVESYIEGQEYALDAYFDEAGEAVVLDVLKHDFAGAQDTSDRLYYTSKRIIEEQLAPMTTFLNRCNKLLGLRNFPIHPEVRIMADGTIIPIEFNPCRFAGLCNTDVAYFAYGIRTYEYFLRNLRPDWDAILAGKDGVAYPMAIATTDKLTGRDLSNVTFNYEAFSQQFSRILELRPLDVQVFNAFAFLFLEVKESDWNSEMLPFLNDTFEGYLD